MCPICMRVPLTSVDRFALVHTSIIVGTLFSCLLPARVLHQAALQLCRARTAMPACPDLVELPPGHRVALEH